jgi:hypothetical protein
MDSSNPRTQASDAANPDGSGETFVGTIRWIALAIGVACLALLTLVGSLAHAAPILEAAPRLNWREAASGRTAAPSYRDPRSCAEMPAAGHATIRQRNWRDLIAQTTQDAALPAPGP